MIKTEITAYNFRMLPFWSSKSTDPLHELYFRDSYMIDTHTPWKELSGAHPNHRFVLGKTFANEAEDLSGILAKNPSDFPYSNVFTFETFAKEGRVAFFMNRLDIDFPYHRRTNLPRISQLTEAEFEAFNERTNREYISKTVLYLVDRGPSRLLDEINFLKGKTRYQVLNSVDLAVRVHAIAILRMKKAKREREIERLRNAEKNIMNDTYLLQEALLLDCGVHTADKKLKIMCHIAGVKIYK